jgi:hypothetical protein
MTKQRRSTTTCPVTETNSYSMESLGMVFAQIAQRIEPSAGPAQTRGGRISIRRRRDVGDAINGVDPPRIAWTTRRCARAIRARLLSISARDCWISRRLRLPMGAPRCVARPIGRTSERVAFVKTQCGPAKPALSTAVRQAVGAASGGRCAAAMQIEMLSPPSGYRPHTCDSS